MPHTLYKSKTNGYNLLAKIDSGASCNCISKSLWDKIKTSNKLAKSQITLTGAEGSKLAFLGFADITCSIGKFSFMEEFAVIEGMVSDMLLGIRWEHKFNINMGWTKTGNHYIAQGKHNFITESANKLNVHPIIKIKGKIMPKPESVSFIEVQAPRDISGNKRYQLNPNTYLPNGIIPLDLIHSFEKTPRTLQLPFLNTSINPSFTFCIYICNYVLSLRCTTSFFPTALLDTLFLSMHIERHLLGRQSPFCSSHVQLQRFENKVNTNFYSI